MNGICFPLLDELHTYWQSPNGGEDFATAHCQHVNAARIDSEDPLASALSGRVLGSESLSKEAIALTNSDDDQMRERKSRRLNAATAGQIIGETAFYHEVCSTEYIGVQSWAAGSGISAMLC